MTIEKVDYKKKFKDLYMPKNKPMIIDVPVMNFIMVDGKGNPNDEVGEYQAAVELLYGLSYAIKMSIKSGRQPIGYFEYVVPPLEGLWWMNESKLDLTAKDKYCWTSMIRQPEFVTEEVFQWALAEVKRKKPHIDISKAYFEGFTEGLCVQMMHFGPFDKEPETLAEMESFIKEENLKSAVSNTLSDGSIRRHHEIYLSDPRKTNSEKMKTVIRQPVSR